MLPVTFGTPANFRTENVTFDVADIRLPYNGILGRPALAKFMAAFHYAYNALKMPANWGVITVKADKKDVVFCVEQMFRAAAAATPGNTDEPRASAQCPTKKKLMKKDSQLTKQVPLRDDGSHPVTIGANLSAK